MCLLDRESQKTVAGVCAQTEWGPGNRSFSADRVRIKVGLKLVTRGKGASDASFLFKVLLSKNIRERTPWSGTTNTQTQGGGLTAARLGQAKHLGFGVKPKYSPGYSPLCHSQGINDSQNLSLLVPQVRTRFTHPL